MGKAKASASTTTGTTRAVAARATAAEPQSRIDRRRARREHARAPERVLEVAALARVRQAVIACRPGTHRGSGSPLWRSLGEEGVHSAARMYLVDHLIAREVSEAMRVPVSQRRAMDRLLDRIQQEYQRICVLDAKRDAAQGMYAPLTGDLATKAGLLLERAFDRLSRVIETMEWDQMSPGQQSATLRMLELAADAKKISADSEHKEAQTRRLERIIQEIERKEQAGERTMDVAVLRGLFSEALGLRPAGGGA